MEAFPVGNAIPSTKILTFYRSLKPEELAANNGQVAFKFEAKYNPAAAARGLPEGCGYNIGSYILSGIKSLPSTEADGKTTIKVKTKLDGDGILSIEGASQIEEVLVPVEEKKAASEGEEKKEEEATTPMDTDEAPSEETLAPEKSVKTKKVIKKHDLQVSVTSASAPSDLLSKWAAAEGEMRASDRLVIDTADRRNALEEYVYDIRSKLEMAWSEFIQDADRTVFMKSLNEVEEWLYGEGEDATKSVYVEKLAELKKMGDPVAFRYLQNDERPAAERKLKDYINSMVLLVDSGVSNPYI
jgi:heat shock protein 4